METMQLDPFWFATLVTLIAGAGGTGLGGVVGALFNTESNKITSLLLAFAGGVMCAIVCLDLLAEAVTAANEVMSSGVILVVGTVFLGVFVVYGVSWAIERHVSSQVPHRASGEHPGTSDDVDELIYADHWKHHQLNGTKGELMAAGIIMGVAIAMHNIPEGMTIGASFVISDDLLFGTGMTMAVLIGLHNIPEGMAVAVPLISGGMGRIRAILVTTASGLPTLLGAWLGLWLGDVGPLGLTLSLAFASGAMLYVVFGEIVPEAVLMHRSKAPGLAAIVGIMLGLLLVSF